MIEQIQALGIAASSLGLAAVVSPGATTVPSVARRAREHKRNTLTKEHKANVDYGHQMNPVSRLIQVQQVRGQPSPRFRFVRETGNARMKEFVVEVRTCVFRVHTHTMVIACRCIAAATRYLALAQGRINGWQNALPRNICSPRLAITSPCPSLASRH
jgi:hypothetical protein